MTLIELNTALKTLGYPVAYSHFKEPTNPPFICYRFTGDDDLKADNRNYKKVRDFDIELYTDRKDLDAEQAVESLLDELELPYSMSETYIPSEKMHQVIYSIQLI